MKQRFLTLALAVTLAAALLACSAGGEEPSSPAEAVPPPESSGSAAPAPSPAVPPESSGPEPPESPSSLPEQEEPESPSSVSEEPPPKEDENDGEKPISPWEYQKRLGKGMDVDWSKTRQGRQHYSAQAAADFAAAGVSHVRIRIADDAEEELLAGLDRQIADCLEQGLIPVIAYQADDFQNDPSEENLRRVADWWGKVAERYRGTSYLLSYDLLIEATDALNKRPERLNDLYEQVVARIRESDPERIIFISPRLRSDPAYLTELKIPTRHNGYLMAEWHFYASGPSKTNERKLWTTGTDEEKAIIEEKIRLALDWQRETGIPTWVGAWMPGNYNDGNDYTVEEQVVFAGYVARRLTDAGIPFAVNSDTKFYDRETNRWIEEMKPVFQCIYGD